MLLPKSMQNWNYKSGVCDVNKLSLVDFVEDYPISGQYFNIENDVKIIYANDYANISNAMLNMFMHDYILERFFRNPLKYVKLFQKAKYIMSPDFSLYNNMPLPLQQMSVYKNRLCAYIWERNNLNVINTVSWGSPRSYDFCFNGIKKHSTVAISTFNIKSKEDLFFFQNGFEAMIEKLQPTQIVCLHSKQPFEFLSKYNILYIDMYSNKFKKK